ncbi:MAG: M20/M25/M40 family metallo-hydrolase, partial [Chitinophagaceae bacterium]
MKKTLILLLTLAAFNASFSQYQQDSAFIKSLSNEILVNGKAYDWLKHLTKKIGHRLSGSSGFNKAVEWGKQTMQQAGANKTFLQSCSIPYWVRGSEKVAISNINGKKVNQQLSALALGNSFGTKNKVITGDVIAFKNLEEFYLNTDKVKNKIVLFNYPFNQTFIETFNAYGDAGKYRRSAASIVAKYGGIAMFTRSLGGGEDNFAHTGTMNYNDSFPKIPAFAIGLKDADYLYQNATTHNIKINFQSGATFKPDTIGYNVVGELTGSEFPNEFITIGGHLDSWDVGEGAHDDGTGCVQTMEVLRAFTSLGYKPKRTIRFVLFANEENGLRGGNKYADEAKNNNEKHVFALESDAGGFTPRGFGFTANDVVLQKIKQWLPLLTPYGTSYLKAGGGGADIGPLQKLGTVLAGLQPDSQRYFDYHHTHNDVFENV